MDCFFQNLEYIRVAKIKWSYDLEQLTVGNILVNVKQSTKEIIFLLSFFFEKRMVDFREIEQFSIN